MLGDSPLNPILPVRDAARAEAFYRDTLGLGQLSEPGEDPIAFAAGNGSMLVLTELPDRTPPPYPVVAFLVADLERLAAELEGRGVEFVPPDSSSFRGATGEARGPVTDYGPVRSAWLRDPDGNILALNELVG